MQLTDDKYRSMYSNYEAASREYANFYNENEIKREKYKTTDAYLIAKANAFNKAYNDGEIFDNTVEGWKDNDFIKHTFPNPKFEDTNLFNLTTNL